MPEAWKAQRASEPFAQSRSETACIFRMRTQKVGGGNARKIRETTWYLFIFFIFIFFYYFLLLFCFYFFYFLFFFIFYRTLPESIGACARAVSSCSCERSFSALRWLKTWCRSSMTDEGLDQLARCCINQERTLPPENTLQAWDRSGHRRIALAFQDRGECLLRTPSHCFGLSGSWRTFAIIRVKRS